MVHERHYVAAWWTHTHVDHQQLTELDLAQAERKVKSAEDSEGILLVRYGDDWNCVCAPGIVPSV